MLLPSDINVLRRDPELPGLAPGLLVNGRGEFQSHTAALAADRTRCESLGHAAREYVAKSHFTETRIRQLENMLLGRS